MESRFACKRHETKQWKMINCLYSPQIAVWTRRRAIQQQQQKHSPIISLYGCFSHLTRNGRTSVQKNIKTIFFILFYFIRSHHSHCCTSISFSTVYVIEQNKKQWIYYYRFERIKIELEKKHTSIVHCISIGERYALAEGFFAFGLMHIAHKLPSISVSAVNWCIYFRLPQVEIRM